MRLRVIDLDSSVATQPPLRALADEGLAQLLDMRAAAPGLRIVARRKSMRAFSAALVAAGPPPGQGPEATFYGSGDFHHLVAALVARHETPLTVIHVDNHPDWVRFPPTFNCGAWVNRALELPQVEKIVTIGPCSDDLVWPQFKSANLAAIRSGKLELFPWSAAPSRIIGGSLQWRNLAAEDFDGFLADLGRKIPTKAVHVTIDKDALTTTEAVTNWDQGGMSLAHVQKLLTSLANSRKILGVDVCGDYSPPRFDDPFRASLAWLDHPPDPKPDDAMLAVNDRTNAALLDTFGSVL